MCVVLLNTIDKVKEFVNITSDFETDVFLKSGRYIIDAKSIMGVFSLDLTKPMKVHFDTDNCEYAAKCAERLKVFAA